MPLTAWPSLDERRLAFEAALSHLVRLGRVPAGLRVNPEPQPICVLSLNDVKGDFHLPTLAERVVSWRYFAGEVSGEVVAGEVSASSPAQVTGMRYGEPAKTELQAVENARALPQAQAGEWQARVLRIPGALVDSIWLKSTDDSNGLVLQFRRRFGLENERVMPVEIGTFLNTLRPVVEQVLSGQDGPVI